VIYCDFGYYLIVKLQQNGKICVFCYWDNNYFVGKIDNSMGSDHLIYYIGYLVFSFCFFFVYMGIVFKDTYYFFQFIS